MLLVRRERREEEVTIRAGSRTRPLPLPPLSLPRRTDSFLWLIKADADHGAHLELKDRLRWGIMGPERPKRSKLKCNKIPRT